MTQVLNGPAVSQFEPQPPKYDDELRQYIDLGHTGYILAFRRRHGGEDPAAEDLLRLARDADRSRKRRVVGILRALIDAVT